MSIRVCPLPADALLHRYRDAGAYTDCYVTDVSFSASQAEFIEAFYSTWVFRMERWILATLVGKPSGDEELRALASGAGDAFAAWTVEGRAPNQLLLSDFQNRTRSWLMSKPLEVGTTSGTRLWFGSAVVPLRDTDGRTRMGLMFRMLLDNVVELF